mmetsp:Transcript_17831/g.30315  ORF Transcript_17831/g.30315 Transcript_17831/m.30315 type:complete len:339 (-) Transcript_17831:1004-2020(-)
MLVDIVCKMDRSSDQGDDNGGAKRLVEMDSSFRSGTDDDEFGRVKAPPMCNEPTLLRDAMDTAAIRPFAFPQGVPFAELKVNGSIEKERKDLNKAVLSETKSRQGRDGQRWLKDSSGEYIRLVTGCVPILKDGRILLVSASRKPEWILPKGGWEEDETIELSAVRETHEEAGVVGELGPRLTEITYETRKSKKRKLEKSKEQADGTDSTVVTLSDDSPSNSEVTANTRKPKDSDLTKEGEEQRQGTAKRMDSFGGEERIRDEKPQTYSFVRMTMFPLYVTEVRDEWPEGGRFRMMVHIDRAIEIFQKRPEFLQVLEELKDKRLHIIGENGTNVDISSS